MLNTGTTLLFLVLFSAAFTVAGIACARGSRDTLEDYIVARNSQTTTATVLTLLASSLGAWVLFAPAQAASWGGLAALVGYACGAMAPRLVLIPLGRRMRALAPQGHTLSEFVFIRYGRGLYALILLIMLFYLGIVLTAEITAMAKLVALIAPIPLWLTAAVVLGCTLLYTAWGGLRASIFTDKLQMIVIIPLLLALLVLGWRVSGGATTVIDGLQARAPQLLDLTQPSGLRAALTFFVAILLTGLFHQGNWQRIYAARSVRAMSRGFLWGGVLVAPVIFLMGLFGLAFVALDAGTDSSVALFSVLLPGLPLWCVVALLPLGLSLVMSSADTAISAVASLVAVDLRRLWPTARSATLMRGARGAVCLLALPVLLASAQGYDVLYLFLLADLLCSAAAFPVFFGLYSARYDGRSALIALLAGLAAGLSRFPAPHEVADHLLEAFLLAALVPVGVSLLLMARRRARAFDFDRLRERISRL